MGMLSQEEMIADAIVKAYLENVWNEFDRMALKGVRSRL